MPSQPAPSDDPTALKAMLVAERLDNERLRKIIRELQRQRFGRRAESLPLDQLQLGLEEAEQAEAADEAAAEAAAPSVRATRVANRVALRQKPDHLHVARLDRIGAAPEMLLQIQDTQVIHDARHGTALQQANQAISISAPGESAPVESMSRMPYEG